MEKKPILIFFECVCQIRDTQQCSALSRQFRRKRHEQLLTGISDGEYGSPRTRMTAHTVTLLQDQSIEKVHTAFRGLLDEREQVRKTKIEIPMCTSFKPTDKHEVDISDKSAVAEMKRWPYRQILGHIMWICMTHPECWHASRVPARHSNHHTKYHRDSLLDCALFLVRVAKGWGIKYTGHAIQMSFVIRLRTSLGEVDACV